MKVLSASEAVAPAFKRTWEIFFKPFKVGRSWKWSISAYISQLGAFLVPFPLLLPFMMRHSFGTAGKIFLWTGCLAATAIAFWFFYLGSRMEFVIFESVATRAPYVRPLWRKYKQQTWRWIGVKLIPLGGLGFLTSVPMARFYALFLSSLPHGPAASAQVEMQRQMQLQAEMAHTMFSMYLFLFVGGGAVCLLTFLCTDFIMPSLAMEDASLSVALRRLRDLVAAEPGQFFSYLLLKMLLLFVGFLAWYVAFLVGVLLLMIPLGIAALVIGGLSWLVFHNFGIIGHAILIAEAIVGYIAFFIGFLYVEFGSIGILPTFLQAYALYFLGGRYQLLGDMLEPPPPPVYAAPPVSAPPPFEPPLPEPTGL